VLGCSIYQSDQGHESFLHSSSNEFNADFFGVQWDRDNPANMSCWQMQHNGLRDLGPSYVYNIFSRDTQGFVQAVKDAIVNPIDRWVEQATMPNKQSE